MVPSPCMVVLRVPLMLLLALRLPLRTLALLLRGVFCMQHQQVLVREAPEKVYPRLLLLLLLLLVVLLLLLRVVQLSRVMVPRCVVLSPRVGVVLVLQQPLAVLLLALVLLLLPLAAAARTGPAPRGCAQRARASLARGRLRCASAAKAAGLRC